MSDIVIEGILGILLIVTLLKFWLYRRQIKSICTQMRFLNENDTNMMISTQLSDPEILKLEEEINEWNSEYMEIIRTCRRKEQTQRENFTNLSHDIRTPLTSLDGYFQMLKECDNETDKKRYEQMIEGRIAQLRDMLEEIFTYTKLQNEDYEMEQQQEDVGQIVYETIFSFYEVFQEQNITPQISFVEKPVYVNCNKVAMSRILHNIIKNAWIHGEKTILLQTIWENQEFSFICKNQMRKGQQVEIEQIFDRFYKADTARNNISTGLGLAIARELTWKMGGRIQAQIQGEWFEIKITFPGFESSCI